MRRRLLAPVAFAALATACTLVVVGDTEVRWALSGSCSDFNIDHWEVTLSGHRESVGPMLYSCGSTWATPVIEVETGDYTATVRAIGPTGQTLATKSKAGSILSTAGVIYFIDVGTFIASDFTANPGGATVHVYWTINDTVDGTDKGISWDACDEVGAASLQLSVDGVKQTLPCSTTATMKKDISVAAGTHTFSAVLVSSSGSPLTSETQTVTLSSLSSTNPGELLLDFPWNSFQEPVKSSTKGNLIFANTFEGKTCAQVPFVTNEITLLKLNGTAVNPPPQVCTASNVCFPADGNTLGPCTNEDMTIKQLLWGSYKLLLQGVNPTKHACYSVGSAPLGEVDVLVGAGTNNPAYDFDLKKIDNTPACQ